MKNYDQSAVDGCFDWVRESTSHADRRHHVDIVTHEKDSDGEEIWYRTWVDAERMLDTRHWYDCSTHALVKRIELGNDACWCAWKVVNEKGVLYPCAEHYLDAVSDWARIRRAAVDEAEKQANSEEKRPTTRVYTDLEIAAGVPGFEMLRASIMRGNDNA